MSLTPDELEALTAREQERQRRIAGWRVSQKKPKRTTLRNFTGPAHMPSDLRIRTPQEIAPRAIKSRFGR